MDTMEWLYHALSFILPIAQAGVNFSILAPDSTVSWHLQQYNPLEKDEVFGHDSFSMFF